MDKSDKNLYIGMGVGFALTTIGTLVIGPYISSKFFGKEKIIVPVSNTIENGYIHPTSLEFRLEDLNKNGTEETILRLNNIDYLFKYENENPILQKYEVTNPQITIKN